MLHASLTGLCRIACSDTVSTSFVPVGNTYRLISTPQTFSYFCTFLLAMTINSDAQQPGQAELGSVVNKDRLPDFVDRDSLPYINAVIKECLRWH